MSANGDPNAPSQPYIAWVDPSGTTQTFGFDLVKSETWNDDATVTEHPVEVGADVADHVRVALDKCELVIRCTNEPIDGNTFQSAVQGPISLSLPVPSWVPANGLLLVPQWQNNIDLRVLAGALVGGLTGGLKGTAGQIGGLVGNAALGLLLHGVEIDVPVQTTAGLQPPAPPTSANAVVQTYANQQDFVEATHAQMKLLRDTGQRLQVFGTKQVNLSMVIETLSFVRNGESGTGEMLTVGFKEVRIVATQVVAAPIPHLPAGGGNPPKNRGGQNPQDAPAAKQGSLATKIVDAAGGVDGAVQKLETFFGFGGA